MSGAGRLVNASTGGTLATGVRMARTPWERAIGMLLRSTIGPDEGLWIPGCPAIHTLGMRSTLDLIFIDRDGVAVRIDRNVGPWKPYVGAPGAAAVIELGPAAHERGISVGDRVTLEP